jgi:hypothetical protein
MLQYPTVTTVISVYIPPHSPISQTQAVTHHIKDLAATCQNIIIMGDLNHPDIDWATLTGNSDSGSLVCDCFFQLNLTQIIHDPTHIRGNTLDIIASNHPQLLKDLYQLTLQLNPLSLTTISSLIHSILPTLLNLTPRKRCGFIGMST